MPHHQDKDEQELPLTGVYQDSSDDTESLLSQTPVVHSRKTRWAPRCCCLSFMFIMSMAISSLLGALLAFHSIDLDKECSAYTSSYSPVLQDVEIKYGKKPFNGSFMHETIYRQPASPEVDEAWEALGVNSRPSVISYEAGLAAGLTPAHAQVAAKYGGGFAVNVEGMHHLHCLNLLRQSLWYNYEYYAAMGHHAFANEEHILQLHVSHCLDTVRQSLMCNVDTGVLGQVWYVAGDDTEGKEKGDLSVSAFPDFNTAHTCKNYDEVRRWAVAHQARPESELPEDYMMIPKDDDVLPAIP
ncbi:tat pathway signal sequence [Xylariaceae sp. FL0016]|nr:tat pathway signal sequence [Xylariaceae sp. FL0016]